MVRVRIRVRVRVRVDFRGSPLREPVSLSQAYTNSAWYSASHGIVHYMACRSPLSEPVAAASDLDETSHGNIANRKQDA